MKKYLPFLFLFAAVLSCKKNEKPQESTWITDGETFMAVATPSMGKAIAILGGSNGSSRFSLSPLIYPKGNGNGETHCCTCTKIQSMLTWTFIAMGNIPSLTETFFINYNNHADSVLISGDFYEP